MKNSKCQPWMKLRRRGHNLTLHQTRLLDDVPRYEQYPHLCLFLGQGQMTHALRQTNKSIRPDIGDISLSHTPRRSSKPAFIVSGPIHSTSIASETEFFRGEVIPRRNDDLDAELPVLYSHVLGPFVDVVCVFPSDFLHPREFVTFVAQWLSQAVKFSCAVLPALVIVIDTHDETPCAKLSWMENFRYQLEQETSIPMTAAFSSVDIFSFDISEDHRDNVYQHLVDLVMNQASAIRAEKRRHQLDFSMEHFAALFDEACKAYICNRIFSHLEASRASCPVPSGAAKCVASFLKTFGVNHDLKEFALPLLASCIVLDAYPPGMHPFDCRDVYRTLYSPMFHNVAKALRLAPQTLMYLEDLVCNGNHTKDDSDNRGRHLKILRAYGEQLEDYVTDAYCLVCLMRRPEYRLPCGHCICEQDIRRFGMQEGEWTWVIKYCVLCQKSTQGANKFRLKPPTKGINVLAIDGGGVRGIIPLQNLYLLEQKLKPLLPHFPVQNHFDLAVGTSSGGLIVLAAVLQGVSISRCIKIFRDLSTKTFRGRFYHLRSGVSRFIKLAVSLFADSVYPAKDIDAALKEQFGEATTLLDYSAASARGAKVAVVVTGLPDGEYVITNYNGTGCRALRRGYRHVIAPNQSTSLRVWDAARATTAAPWYFTPHTIAGVGKKFQDGGLWRNNPMDLGESEAKAKWPHIAQPDLALSLGTGYRLDSNGPSSPQSPLTPIDSSDVQECKHAANDHSGRSLKRLLHSFLGSIVMDGEKFHELSSQWNQHSGNTQYGFRLNIGLSGAPPALDDISSIEPLRCQTESQQTHNSVLDEIAERMISTLFYFELSERPLKTRKLTHCRGRIICHIEPGSILVHFIKALEQNEYAFSVLNKSLPILTSTQYDLNLKIYQIPVEISLQSLESTFHITLQRGGRSTPQELDISASPFTLIGLMRRQGWMNPFGREDHGPVEPDPKTAQKRKRCGRYTARRTKGKR